MESKILDDTLLSLFIEIKKRACIEPTRKGIPKGNPIGFPKKKIAASLYMMTNKKQKDIAKHLKISYGVLRNWNTQKNFKSKIKENNKEFANQVLEHIEKDLSKEFQKIEKLKFTATFKLSLKYLAIKELLKVDGSNDYSSDLILMILNLLQSRKLLNSRFARALYSF